MFLSSYENKLDKKGRVSVPSSFRAYLNSMGYNGFITYPSFNHAALDACAQDRIEKLSESTNLNFDSEGRVSIPEKLLKHAKIKSNIVFVGLGKVFQMWDPKSFENFNAVARKKSYINRSTLKWDNKFKKEGL